MSSLVELIDSRIGNPVNARKAARAARIDERLARLSSGEFLAPGVISSAYIDHGVGRNLMFYTHVDISGYAYGPWLRFNGTTWNAVTGVTLVAPQMTGGYPDTREQDALAFGVTGAGAYSSYRSFFPFEGTLEEEATHIYSAHVKPYSSVSGVVVQLRPTFYATASDAETQTSGTVGTESTEQTLTAGEVNRVKLEFVVPVGKPYVRLEHRVKRDSPSGTVDTVNWYDFMLEQVVAGQTEPSKFVRPNPKRGELPVSLLESDAFRTYISGLEVNRESNSSLSISPGQCYIPGLNRLVSLGTAQTVSFTPVTGPTVRYVYAGADSDGSFVASIGTGTPGSPYAGTARTLSGDTTKRFIGSIIIYDNRVPQFKREGDYFYFTDNLETNNGAGFPWRQPLSDGGSGGAVVSLAGLVPPHANSVDIVLRLKQPGSSPNFTTARIGHPALPGNLGAAVNAGSSEAVMSVAVGPQESARSAIRGVVRTDNSSGQNINYSVASPTSPTATLDIEVMGWYEQR